MPCFDAQEAYDRGVAAQRYDALTAILCGVMNNVPAANLFAQEWHEHHANVDFLRKKVEFDFQDPEIAKALERSNAVLDRAYQELCKK